MLGGNKNTLGDCRFYEQKFPNPGDLLMVKVNRIEAQGVYVSLLEYDDREGRSIPVLLCKVVQVLFY